MTVNRKFKKSFRWPETLWRLMHQHHVSSLQLSRCVGLSHVTIGNYLAGRLPRADHLAALADFFHCTMDGLMGRTHHKRKCRSCGPKEN